LYFVDVKTEKFRKNMIHEGGGFRVDVGEFVSFGMF